MELKVHVPSLSLTITLLSIILDGIERLFQLENLENSYNMMIILDGIERFVKHCYSDSTACGYMIILDGIESQNSLLLSFQFDKSDNP